MLWPWLPAPMSVVRARPTVRQRSNICATHFLTSCPLKESSASKNKQNTCNRSPYCTLVQLPLIDLPWLILFQHFIESNLKRSHPQSRLCRLMLVIQFSTFNSTKKVVLQGWNRWESSVHVANWKCTFTMHKRVDLHTHENTLQHVYEGVGNNTLGRNYRKWQCSIPTHWPRNRIIWRFRPLSKHNSNFFLINQKPSSGAV